ncbi:MAG: UDP-N-acetylmuramoyl-L-alanine--D-glutamate ligase [Bacteroidales bacterium]|nr:UDP-N-acetylmuramoyl-L-alanine--D-glutamate ligase [Bacteroidales bacterium]
MYREQQLKSLLEGRRLLVAGYGREGQSAERLIKRLLPHTEYAVATEVKDLRWKDFGGQWHDEWPFDLVVKSPGIPTFQFPAQGFRLSSLTDLFLQVYGDRTIGVTGTKGKSTTASLIHHLLPGSFLAGNIGVPLFDILDELDERCIVVAELSCHQLENIHRAPHISVLLNLFQEHLDHYGDYMGYKMAKMQTALRQREGDHFFFCADNEELRDLVALCLHPDRGDASGCVSTGANVHPYSLADVSPEERQLLDVFPLPGDHNSSNALVACRVAGLVLQQPLSSLRVPLSTFKGLRHRMERVGEKCGITWYDDSISTIPEAAIAAVRALGHVDTLILGGFDRGIDYSPLVSFLEDHPVSNLVFVGQAGRRIYSRFSILNSQYLVEDDYTKIVPWCVAHTPQGGVVLLSPAAASYDTFKNFEHRGDFFAEQIKKL